MHEYQSKHSQSLKIWLGGLAASIRLRKGSTPLHDIVLLPRQKI